MLVRGGHFSALDQPSCRTFAGRQPHHREYLKYVRSVVAWALVTIPTTDSEFSRRSVHRHRSDRFEPRSDDYTDFVRDQSTIEMSIVYLSAARDS